MFGRKFLNIVFSLLLLTSLFLGGMSKAQIVTAASAEIVTAASAQTAVAAPTSPTDESKVPHYFGPSPNWANSPFTLPPKKKLT